MQGVGECKQISEETTWLSNFRACCNWPSLKEFFELYLCQGKCKGFPETEAFGVDEKKGLICKLDKQTSKVDRKQGWGASRELHTDNLLFWHISESGHARQVRQIYQKKIGKPIPTSLKAKPSSCLVWLCRGFVMSLSLDMRDWGLL